MAHPIGRLSCSAHPPTASELWPPACASVTDCSHLPAPEDPVRSLDPALHHTGAHTSSKKPGPAMECWCGGTGEGLGQMNLPLPEAGLPWPSCRPRGSGVLGLCGAYIWSQGDLSSKHFFFSLTDLDSASCQSRGACHCLPTLPVPELHAHQPRPPEDKGLHCLHSPSLAPYLLWPVWLPEEGRTRFLLLVLTPLQSQHPHPTPVASPWALFSLKA